MNIANSLLHKLVLNISVKGLSVMLALSMHILLAQWLSGSDYGTFALLQTLSVGLAILGQAGTSNAYMKLLAARKSLSGAKVITRAIFRLITPFFILAALLYFVIVTALIHSNKINTLSPSLMFFGYMLIHIILMLLFGWYRARDKAYAASFLEQGSYSGLTIILCFIWVSFSSVKLDLFVVSLFFLISACLICGFATANWWKTIKQDTNDELSLDFYRVKKLTHNLLATETATYLTTWGGVIITGVLLATEDVAHLNSAQRVAQVVVFLLISINGVIAPRFSRLSSEKDLENLAKLAQQTTIALTLFTLPIASFLVIYGRDILRIFGDGYINAYPLLVTLVLGQVVNALTGSVGLLLNMTGFEYIQRNIVITSSIVTFSSSIFATFVWGVHGAAFSVTLGVCLNNLFSAYFVYKKLGFFTILGLQKINKKYS